MPRKKSLGLISCTSKKRSEVCVASEMYDVSALFQKALKYCKKTYNDVAILSAEYGLVFLEDELEPYDKTLNDMSVEERKNWAQKVFVKMQERLNLSEYEKVFFHAGKHYNEFLIPKLEALTINCAIPLEHLRIGEQLNFYITHDC